MTPLVTLPPRLAATLVMVRHGESEWIVEGRFQGRRDPRLSQLGRRQAALAASRLADRLPVGLPIPDGPPIGIWHSPLSRAADTARAIAAAQPGPPPLHATDYLIEIAQGEWEGLRHAEVSQRWPEELARWRRTPTAAHAPGGEPLTEAAVRVTRGVQEILDALARASAPLESSSDDARAAAGVASSPVPGYPVPADPSGSAPEPWAIAVAHDGIFRLMLMTLAGVPLERFWSFPFSLCGISVVGLGDGSAALRCHNVADHLAPLADEARAAQEARGDRRGAL